MKHLSATVTKELDYAMREIHAGELAGVSGGGFVIVGDGYCGTPVPWPPHLPTLATSPLVSDPSPVLAGAGL
jgi:hypothetical protein